MYICRDVKLSRRNLKKMSKSTDIAETNYLATIWSYRCFNPLDIIIDGRVIMCGIILPLWTNGGQPWIKSD